MSLKSLKHSLPRPRPAHAATAAAAAATMINIVLNDKQAKMCQGNNKPAKLIAFNRKARGGAKLPSEAGRGTGRGRQRLGEVKSEEQQQQQSQKELGQLAVYPRRNLA